MLIQLDGSYHPWLGDQAPPFTLLIAVDDATGQVVSAWFCEHEDARSYFRLIRALVEHRGVARGPLHRFATPCSSTRRDPASLQGPPSSAGPWMRWGPRLTTISPAGSDDYFCRSRWAIIQASGELLRGTPLVQIHGESELY